MIEYWSNFLSDCSNESSVRLAFLTWCLGVLLVWGYVCIHENELAIIPDSVIYVLGILMTGKYLSKKVEVSKEGRKSCTENQEIPEKKNS